MSSLFRHLRFGPAPDSSSYEVIRTKRIEEVRALLQEIAAPASSEKRRPDQAGKRTNAKEREVCCA
jgi:hypothetical protein